MQQETKTRKPRQTKAQKEAAAAAAAIQPQQPAPTAASEPEPTPAPTEERKVNPIREKLWKLSQELQPAVKGGLFSNANDALIATYTTDQHKTFKTFDQWQREGYNVHKGAECFPIWGKPRTNEGSDKQYFPTVHLFSNSQVYKREANAANA